MNSEELKALLQQADEHNDTGNYDQAELLANQVLAELKQEGASSHAGEQKKSDSHNQERSQSNTRVSLRCSAFIILSVSKRNRGDFQTALSFAHASLDSMAEADNPDLKVRALCNIGVVYDELSDYNNALRCFQESLAICEEIGTKAGIANNLGSIGIVYQHLAEFENALSYFLRALALFEEMGTKDGIAANLNNIGLSYKYLSDYTRALEYYKMAMVINEETNNMAWLANNLGNIGGVYIDLKDYDNGLRYYQNALSLNEALGRKGGIANNLGAIGTVYHDLLDYTNAVDCYQKALAISKEIGMKQGIAANLMNIGELYTTLSRYDDALIYCQQALVLFEEIGMKHGIAYNLGCLGTLYAQPTYHGYDARKAEAYLQRALALNLESGSKQQLYHVHKHLADLYEGEKKDSLALFHFKKYHELKDEVQSDEAIKQANLLEQRRQAAEREKEIEIERSRASAEKNILNNILPEQITQRLIKGENPIADHFDCVSVLFMDIVDFTPLASSISAQQLVHLLNAIFSADDSVMREYGMEKIKTIGDAYMAVAGAPTVQEDHAHRAAQAALKLLEVMEKLEVAFPDSYGDKSWIESIPDIKVRIGLHCGPVAAGVVGENKFLYDLWGDAVNTAARMESHGEASRIHVSDEFVMALSAAVIPAKAGIHFRERGEMDIKGKGIMKTYFLEKA